MKSHEKIMRKNHIGRRGDIKDKKAWDMRRHREMCPLDGP